MNQQVRPLRTVSPPPNTPSSDQFAQAREYLARVLPWPNVGDETAYVDVIWTYKGEGYDKPAWTGRACSSVNDAIRNVQWAMGKPDTRDVYVCMSTQRECDERVGQTGKPYKFAVRSQQNAVALKSLFLDIDCKGEGYANIDDAIAGLAAFLKAVDLPKPTIVVASGGGLHVYWVMSRALPVEEWKPLAFALAEATKRHGLHCDTQCSIDSARVLRIPNTFNRKSDPPRPVVIAGTPQDFDYSVERIERVLEPYKVAVPVAASSSFIEKPSEFPKLTAVKDELGAGIEQHSALVDLDSVASECAFIRHAVATGGKDYSNPLWNLTTLISTFTARGRADAHRMADQHPDYSPGSTDDLFDRKEREKASKGLGWPSCQTISASGCNACHKCPHVAAGKSPLHLAGLALPSQVTTAAASTPFADPYSDFVGPAFPLQILPPPLANFVEAEHRAMGADPSALALASVTTVAGAMHANTNVRMGDGWYEPPIIWAGLIGPPSSQKSPIIEKATAPLRKIDQQRDALWRQQYSVWKQNKVPGVNPGPCPPKLGRLIIQDATSEKVAEILSRDPAGSLLVHDELAALIGSFERYSNGQASRAFQLSSWNGGPFLKDRVGQGARDENAEIRVENLALCVLGGIQPDRLATLRDLTGDGLLQRFLPVLMRAPARGDENYAVTAAENEFARLIQNVQHAIPRRYDFLPEAAKIRRRVLDRLYSLEQVQGFSGALIGAIGKLRGYFGRLAVTLHVANAHAAAMCGQGSALGTSIPQHTAEAAEKLIFDFLLPHIFALYDVLANGGKDRDTIRAIAGFILASDKDRLRPSDITAGVRKLRGQSHREIADWASRFCAMGWLQPENENAPVASAWVVVPGLREHFADRRQQAQRARAEAHAILSAAGSRR